MPVITRALLRKRAEHNEGMISTLEEVSLHQEELEGINEVLGATCRKIKILYLQNNIIPRLENLWHLKDLEYLNVALNNISKIEGLQNCEFLNKLDLTVNFIDVDELESSISHLAERERLRDLYMMGNPCQGNWEGFVSYVIARLPQLETLDGTSITRSMRIIAQQKLPQLEKELQQLAKTRRIEKERERLDKERERKEREKEREEEGDDVIDCDAEREKEKERRLEEREKLTDHSPETRNEIYRELAQQKKEKEEREKMNHPRERDIEKEHKESIARIREREEATGEREIKQKNEGHWSFSWDESSSLSLSLSVSLPSHLDSSLIDVDVHPSYISVIIKNKCLRLKTPSEVRVEGSKCQRSKVTGALKVIMLKENPKEKLGGIYERENKTEKEKEKERQKEREKRNGRTTVFRNKPKKTLAEELQEAAFSPSFSPSLSLSPSLSSGGCVDIKNIVKRETEKEESGSFSLSLSPTRVKDLVQEIDTMTCDDIKRERENESGQTIMERERERGVSNEIREKEKEKERDIKIENNMLNSMDSID